MFLDTRKSLFFLLLLMPVIAAAAFVSYKTLPVFSGISSYTVVLDAGHGAPDGGAVGPNGTEEKDVNLDIVLKIREILESRGVKVILTRESDNGIYDASADSIRKKKISDMHNRREIINKSGADVFISIHMNAFTNKNSKGLHVFYSRSHPESKELAQRIIDKISFVTGAEAHEVKTASDTLYLMKNPVPPAILIECGFISNPEEERLLNTDKYKSKLAYAIADAIADNL